MKCTSCRWTIQNGKRWIHHFKSKLWKVEQTILTGGKILNNRCWPNIQCFNGTYKPIKAHNLKHRFYNSYYLMMTAKERSGLFYHGIYKFTDFSIILKLNITFGNRSVTYRIYIYIYLYIYILSF